MAISQMAKVMIVSHRSEAGELLEALQGSGLCQILNAEEAMVTKDWPELEVSAERPKEIEELLGRLTKSVSFLSDYGEVPKGLASALAPRAVVGRQQYDDVVSDASIVDVVEEAGRCEATIEKLQTEIENLSGNLKELRPWAALETPVEQIGPMRTTTALAGLLPSQNLEEVREQFAQLGAVIQSVGTLNNRYACLVVCVNESLGEVHKRLRAADFDQVSFERMTGTAAELIDLYSEKLEQTKGQLKAQYEQAASLGRNLLKLQILWDHYTNVLRREQTKGNAPATGQAVIFEAWTRKSNYRRLEKIVGGFAASSMSEIKPGEDEEIPVEIENTNAVRPFEVITRLYGMPQHFEVDPTAFLAPFFALFFALCLTDAGYGLIIIGLAILFIKKMQGDKKLMWMLGICSVITVGAGALTGGWFGDAIQKFVPALGPVREKMMWFDPFEKPMMFFVLSLAVGYIHIMTGLVIAFIHNLRRKDYIAGLCDQLTWLVMLNSIVIYGAGKGGVVPGWLGGFCGKLAFVPAVIIFLFSQREGGWAGRLGMGAYNLFSTIFYMGDVLSYLRLMALGMVTAGLAMAINVIAKITLDIPYIGFLVMIIVLIGGHSFNLAISGLSAFVHTLRLQYVEFFPKFLVGGGRLFEPLRKEYKHIYIEKPEKSS